MPAFDEMAGPEESQEIEETPIEAAPEEVPAEESGEAEEDSEKEEDRERELD